MALPTVMVIGPMKSGTTWLHSYLQEREDICLPGGVKETFYFDRNFDRGLDWYQKHFAKYNSGKHRTVVEIGPSYFHCDAAPARIRNQLGEVRLVVLVRDPIRRAWSHYCHLLRYGYTRRSLQQAAAEFPAIVGASCYSARLATWSQHFPKAAIRICSFEKLRLDQADFCRDVCDAMGIPVVDAAPTQERETYSGAASASPALARVSRSVTHALRRYRMHALVNALRELGLKRVVYGNPSKSQPPQLTGGDSAWLKQKLSPDMMKFRDMVDPSDHPWLQEYG